MAGARRLLLRPLTGSARRALLMACLWLAFLAALPASAQVITAAEYTTPTSAYPHGALGDEVEWAAIRITVSRRKGSDGDLFQGHLNLTFEIKAPEGMVFEDTEPRLWDIDGDGEPEVVSVLSHQKAGAQLVIISYREGAFTYLATTPPIGQRFRWLAPVGAADLDGDGHIEIAYIDRPHLAKTLRIWRFRDGTLVPVADQAGLTNHKIGWDFIAGGLRDCGGRPELITSNADWTRIVATTLANGKTETRDIGPYRNPSHLDAALLCN